MFGLDDILGFALFEETRKEIEREEEEKEREWQRFLHGDDEKKDNDDVPYGIYSSNDDNDSLWN